MSQLKHVGQETIVTVRDREVTNEEKNIVEIITYIKTTACVEATRRCVWMSRLKHVDRETIVTVRDREVRRDGGIFARRVGV